MIQKMKRIHILWILSKRLLKGNIVKTKQNKKQIYSKKLG